jgi:hypothetical protein
MITPATSAYAPNVMRPTMAEWFALNVMTAATISATIARPRGTVQYRSRRTGTDDGALTRDFFQRGWGTAQVYARHGWTSFARRNAPREEVIQVEHGNSIKSTA